MQCQKLLHLVHQPIIDNFLLHTHNFNQNIIIYQLWNAKNLLQIFNCMRKCLQDTNLDHQKHNYLLIRHFKLFMTPFT